MYANGEGVAQDYAQAMKWYLLAADRGYAKAQFNLGWMYGTGQGVVQDDQQAVRWYRLAATQGFAEAQYNFAVMYANGHSVKQDYKKSHMWANIAKINGVERAKNLMAALEDAMSEADISAAQNLASKCLYSTYKNC